MNPQRDADLRVRHRGSFAQFERHVICYDKHGCFNLAVNDTDRSTPFFTSLGNSFNPQFSNDTTGCPVISEHMYAMLMTHDQFAQFSSKQVVDPRTQVEVLISLSAQSQEDVLSVCEKAFASDGRRYKDPGDHGFMFGWGFEDPEGTFGATDG